MLGALNGLTTSVILATHGHDLTPLLIAWIAAMIVRLSFGSSIAQSLSIKLDKDAAPGAIATIIGLSIAIPVLGGIVVWLFLV